MKKYSFAEIIRIIIDYKLPNIMFCISKLLFKKCHLRNIIVIESHNDFDMNGGAFYNYLIDNGYNMKYTIVWLVKNKRKTNLPRNVKTVPLLGPSIQRDFYNNIAKFFFFDNTFLKKARNNQVFVYMGHATRAMKDCRGYISVPNYFDYVISASEFNDKLMSDIYRITKSKFIVTGFPVTDTLLKQSKDMIKVWNTINGDKKIIIWMPTFRKSNQVTGRADSILYTETGLPIVENKLHIKKLEENLAKNNIKLIIKLHPVQDVKEIKIPSSEYITLLTPKDIKDMGIDTYDLLANSSALISDYSSISFDYLLLDCPIAYVLSDYKQYKLGFAVDNPKDFMPGDYLYTFNDFIGFIKKVATGVDDHKEERNALKNKIHTYQDGKSCERIANFLGL